MPMLLGGVVAWALAVIIPYGRMIRVSAQLCKMERDQPQEQREPEPEPEPEFTCKVEPELVPQPQLELELSVAPGKKVKWLKDSSTIPPGSIGVVTRIQDDGKVMVTFPEGSKSIRPKDLVPAGTDIGGPATWMANAEVSPGKNRGVGRRATPSPLVIEARNE